jgi:hypothetical protein
MPQVVFWGYTDKPADEEQAAAVNRARDSPISENYDDCGSLSNNHGRC